MLPVVAVPVVPPVPSEPDATWKLTVTFAIGEPLLFTASTSRSVGAGRPCSRTWLLPLVIKRDEPLEPVVLPPPPELALATFTVNTAVPAVEVARTETVAADEPAVNMVFALPFEFEVAVAAETVPPFAVVTVNETSTPETGVPSA